MSGEPGPMAAYVLDAGAAYGDRDPRQVVAALALRLADEWDSGDRGAAPRGLLSRVLGMLERNAGDPPSELMRIKARVLVGEAEYVLPESYRTDTMPRLLAALG
jgi:hypothetical protein